MPLPLALLAATLAAATPAPSCQATSPDHQVALVELYTSQGCSSCPPADRWLSTLGRHAHASDLVPIALHVGYWDYIGWKDPYANPAHNERQRALAQANGSRSVYTPGVFLQGRELPRWSDAARFEREVLSVIRSPARARLRLAARFEVDRVVIEAKAAARAGATLREPRLVVALVQDGLDTAVSAGENRGARLRNDRVVRQWSGALGLEPAPISWALPAGVDPRRLRVVAFVEERREGAGVLQALELSLGAC